MQAKLTFLRRLDSCFPSCVIAELFLEGAPIFSLSQLFKYRSSDYDPGPELDKIEDDDIKVRSYCERLGWM